MKNVERRAAVNCSRRFTKTSTSLVFCFEYCLRNKNAQVIFCAPVRSEIKTIVRNIVNAHILKDISTDIAPTYVESRHEFLFSNGSVFRMFGANGGNADSARGNAADVIILDEMSQFDDCEYVVSSVFNPMLLTTKGLMIGLSTPATTTDHYFYDFCQQCKLTNTYFERTIFDNTSLTQSDIDEMADMCGGYESTTFKREFLCQWVRDETKTIVPEFGSHMVQHYNHTEYYNYYHKFVSIDWGVRDNTAALFATYDFHKQRLYIEKEIQIVGHEVTIENIATRCKQVEKDLNWTSALRVGDSSDPIVMNSLTTNHSYPISATSKASLAEMVSELRSAVKNQKIMIDASCKYILNDLEVGQWDDQRKAFKRTKTGHCDSLAALVYLWHTVKMYQNSNPVPASFGTSFTQVRRHSVQEEEYLEHQTFKQIFKGK